MMLTLMLTSKGVAGVPRAALVVLTATLTHVRPAARGRGDPARHRSDPRHGPDGGERHGQLHRHGGRRALGRRVRRRADAAFDAETQAASRNDADCWSLGAARTARRGGRARCRARAATRSWRSTDAALDLTDAGAVTAAIDARAARRRSSTAPRTTTSTAPRTHPVEALRRQRARRAVAGARGRASRRDARPLQHRLRVRRRRRSRRTPRTIRPNPQSVYAVVEAARRVVRRATRRARYVLRVESLFGGRLSRARKGSVDRIVDALLAGGGAAVFADRMVSPSYVDRRRRGHRDDCSSGRAGRPLSLRERGPYCTWLELAREARPAAGGRAARLDAVSVRGCARCRRRALATARCRTRRLASRRRSRCRPGRMRWRAI